MKNKKTPVHSAGGSVQLSIEGKTAFRNEISFTAGQSKLPWTNQHISKRPFKDCLCCGTIYNLFFLYSPLAGKTSGWRTSRMKARGFRELSVPSKNLFYYAFSLFFHSSCSLSPLKGGETSCKNRCF